ncbi:MAG TPA: hypothetical protein PK096_02870, partial [Candidatus Saccharibacteria bacterium]|nr:hypothetical protein [Candidatus Saccharibacteria bacterium]
ERATEVADRAEERLTGQGDEPQPEADSATEPTNDSGSQSEEPLDDDLSLSDRVRWHNEILTAREGSDRHNRLEDIEADVTQLRARVDQLETGQRDIRAVAVSAFASVTGMTANMVRYVQTAGITFLVVLAVCLVIVGTSDMTLDWWVLGVPALAAAIALGIMMFLDRSNAVTASARASASAAQTIIDRWAVEDRQRERNSRRSGVPHRDDDQQPTGARASASAASSAEAR